MGYTGYRSLKKSKPNIDELVEVAHIISGIGAPERKGWYSTGRLKSDGKWTIKQNGDVDYREPTHWRKLKN